MISVLRFEKHTGEGETSLAAVIAPGCDSHSTCSWLAETGVGTGEGSAWAPVITFRARDAGDPTDLGAEPFSFFTACKNRCKKSLTYGAYHDRLVARARPFCQGHWDFENEPFTFLFDG